MPNGLLFYDCETTDKWDFMAGTGAEHQPRIVQFAALATDAEGIEVASISAIIRPDDGWKVAPGALSLHGITTERAAAVGLPIDMVLGLFGQCMDFSGTLVCHNAQFDRALVTRELQLIGGKDYAETLMASRPHYCTMLGSTELCKLPPFRRGKYKWPKLNEAISVLLGIKEGVQHELGAHDAMADARGCRDLYFELRRRGVA